MGDGGGHSEQGTRRDHALSPLFAAHDLRVAAPPAGARLSHKLLDGRLREPAIGVEPRAHLACKHCEGEHCAVECVGVDELVGVFGIGRLARDREIHVKLQIKRRKRRKQRKRRMPARECILRVRRLERVPQRFKRPAHLQLHRVQEARAEASERGAKAMRRQVGRPRVRDLRAKALALRAAPPVADDC